MVLGNDPYIFTKYRVIFGSDALVVDFQAILTGVFPCFCHNIVLSLWMKGAVNLYYMMCIEQLPPLGDNTSEKPQPYTW